MIHLSSRSHQKDNKFSGCFSSSQPLDTFLLFADLVITAVFSRRGLYGNGFELIESLAKKGCFWQKWDSGGESESLWHLVLMYPFSQREFLISWNIKIFGEGSEMESNYKTDERTSEKGKNDTVDDGIAFNLSCRLMAWILMGVPKGFEKWKFQWMKLKLHSIFRHENMHLHGVSIVIFKTHYKTLKWQHKHPLLNDEWFCSFLKKSFSQIFCHTKSDSDHPARPQSSLNGFFSCVMHSEYR